MSFNSNYYNLHGNNSTFQQFVSPNFPPPPLPPPYFMPPAPIVPAPNADEQVIKQLESKVTSRTPKENKSKRISLSQAREQLHNAVFVINDLKSKEKVLTESIESLSEEEWASNMDEIEKIKAKINEMLSCINESYVITLKKAVAKRLSKRRRMRRVCEERKREKEERYKELTERSRKIDENLQKIKDDINKAIEEDKAKLQADIVLKEVLRKKYDAKKCVTKLDALLKMYRAKQNTAKGRGETVSESDANVFQDKLEKLKALWKIKLSLYENEENDLRATLKQNKDLDLSTNEAQQETEKNLKEWRSCLFGDDVVPQADFCGDVGRFVAVRSQWDQYLSSEGKPLPIGWVVPTRNSW